MMPRHAVKLDEVRLNHLRDQIKAHRMRATRLRRQLMDEFDALNAEEKLEYLLLMVTDAQASAAELGHELMRHLKAHRKNRKQDNAPDPDTESF